MELTPEQIAFIRKDVEHRGITLDGMADSLTDHICCVIENSIFSDFQAAYADAISMFGDGGIKKIELETILILTIKRKIIMKKSMFLMGYIAAFLITTGMLFKLQHWPFASIMLTLGIVLLNFGFLPMYFYDRYKRSIAE